MTRTTIVKTWIAGLVALAAGLLIVGVSVGAMLAYGGHFEPAPYGSNGYDFVPSLDSTFWTAVAFIVLGGVAAFIGWAVQLVAWVGAVMNTSRLADKTWFSMLLIGGLVGVVFAPVGFAVMVAYAIGGPDGLAAPQTPPEAPVARPTTLVPTS